MRPSQEEVVHRKNQNITSDATTLEAAEEVTMPTPPLILSPLVFKRIGSHSVGTYTAGGVLVTYDPATRPEPIRTHPSTGTLPSFPVSTKCQEHVKVTREVRETIPHLLTPLPQRRQWTKQETPCVRPSIIRTGLLFTKRR